MIRVRKEPSSQHNTNNLDNIAIGCQFFHRLSWSRPQHAGLCTS